MIGLPEHLDALAADLACRRIDEIHAAPEGGPTARFTGPVHPSRDAVPRHWLRASGLAYDTRSRSVSGVDVAPGTVHVRAADGTDLCSVASRRAPLSWSSPSWSGRPGGPVLAGTTAGARPTLWIYVPARDELRVLDDVEVSRSLLGWVDGPTCPLYWTAEGDLLVMAAESGADLVEADVVRDPSDGFGGLDDPEALLDAARVTILRVGTDGRRDTVARPGAVCHLAHGPDGDGFRVASVRDVPELDRLIRTHRARVELLDVRPAAIPVRGAPASNGRPAVVAGPRRTVHQLSDDVSLHLPDDADDADGGDGPIPTVLWLFPLPEVEPDRRERLPPFRGEGADIPPGAVWSYLPRCAVAMVRLWHPPQNGPAPFDLFADRVTRGVRAAARLVRRAGGPTPLAVAAHSFGASVAALALPGVADLVDCAVLRCGAYNRTLTPGGFQRERRLLWEAPDMYRGFTALHAAGRIRVPTLLLQGAADPNTSTTALQARLFYESLRLAGVPTRLVLVAGEAHQFGTTEGILHAVREEHAWLDRWCRREGSTDHAEHDHRRDPVRATRHGGPYEGDPGAAPGVPTRHRT